MVIALLGTVENPTVHLLHFSEILIRLAAAALFGLVIGFERQWHQRAAGVQTTGLVATGAALFCIAPLALGESTGDPMRVVAAVVQGVGFIAGGVILKEGMNVRGLNTASTVWATAAVGALCGVGLIREGALGALAIVTLNFSFVPIARAIDQRLARFIEKHKPPEEPIS